MSINYRHADRLRKRKVYFVKSFSSLYDGTAENDFTKRKQPQGKLDVFLAVSLYLLRCVKNRRILHLSFLFSLLAVDRLFRRSESSAQKGRAFYIKSYHCLHSFREFVHYSHSVRYNIIHVVSPDFKLIFPLSPLKIF